MVRAIRGEGSCGTKCARRRIRRLRDETGLPLFAPPGLFDHACSLVSEEGVIDMRRVFDAHTVEPGEEFEVGPFQVRTAPMNHPVPTLGMRVEADGSVLAYSADTGPSEDLVALARQADLLLSEATWLEAPEGVMALHLTGRQAGEHAARAGAGALMLTHIWPTFDREAVADRAREAFQGDVLLAEEGLRMEL